MNFGGNSRRGVVIEDERWKKEYGARGGCMKRLLLVQEINERMIYRPRQIINKVC